MMRPGTFPVIEAKGKPFEIGFTHGARTKTEIRRGIELYEGLFRGWANLSWEEAKERAIANYVPFVSKADPDLVEEIRGIAAGSDLAFEDIMTLNARSEVMFAQSEALPPPSDGCSSFAVGPAGSANGHTYVGQNWDWKPEQIENLIILKIEQQGKPGIFMVTEAGIIGKIGLNSAGVAVCLNALSGGDDYPAGLPLHFVLRRILNSYSLGEAIAAINALPVAGPGNYMMGARDGSTIDVEKTTHAWACLANETGVLAHANHVLDPVLKTKFNDTGPISGPDTLFRCQMLQQLLGQKNGGVTVEYLQECLRSHDGYPGSICHHVDGRLPEPRQMGTVFSIIMDLSASEVWLASGNPCESEYTRYQVYFD